MEPHESRESQPSSDEYQLYYYDTRQAKAAEPAPPKKKNDSPNPFVGIKKMEDRIEVKLALYIVIFAFLKHHCVLL